MAPLDHEISERRRIFDALVPYFGTVQPASFFRDTSTVVKGITRIHPLIEGIYKPAGSIYPLSVASMLKSRYGDQLFHNPDRTWWMQEELIDHKPLMMHGETTAFLLEA